VLRRLLESVPPAAGAQVMGTGICSIALAFDGEMTLSRVLAAITAAIWLVLAGVVGWRAARRPDRLRAQARAPAALTAVAGTAVLGTRVAIFGWEWAAVALLAVAVVAWALLLAPVLSGWTTPTVGAAFMLTVATESLAALAASVAVRQHASWLLIVALAPFALGFAAYFVVLARFDLRQLAVGRGDHWITGGALAITTLVVAQISAGARQLGTLGDGGLLASISLAVWAMSILWLPALVLAELRSPRLRYEVLRWSTVFPLGMYAACSFVVGGAVPAAGIASFARFWVWVAFAVWLVVAAGAIARGLGALTSRGEHIAAGP
jgi:hypothetical protein